MADFSNRQLAEIITETAQNIQKNVLQQKKISNQINSTSEKFGGHLQEFDKKVDKLGRTSLEPDLSRINKFYEEITAENVKRLNSRLNVPNFVVYVWLGSFLMLLANCLFFWHSVKSKQEIITEYRSELLKEKVIISKEDNLIFEDMDQWFRKNPKTLKSFVKWRSENK